MPDTIDCKWILHVHLVQNAEHQPASGAVYSGNNLRAEQGSWYARKRKHTVEKAVLSPGAAATMSNEDSASAPLRYTSNRRLPGVDVPT